MIPLNRSGIPQNSDLPTELKQAAELLDKRLELLHSRSRKVKPEEWTQLVPKLRAAVPAWLITLHASFSLCGCVLQTTEPVDGYSLDFRFCDPKTLAAVFGDEDIYALLENGFFPVGAEQDGNLWLLKSSDGPESAIYWFRSTRWDRSAAANRSAAAIEKACTFASEKLAYAMLAMEISNNSCDPANGAMWSRVERQDE